MKVLTKNRQKCRAVSKHASAVMPWQYNALREPAKTYCFTDLIFSFLRKADEISTISQACMHALFVIQLQLANLQSVSYVHVSLQSVMCYTSMIQTSCLPEWVNVSFTNKWTDACIHTPRSEPNTSWITQTPQSLPVQHDKQHFLLISLSDTPGFLSSPADSIWRNREKEDWRREREIFQSISSNIDQQQHKGPDVPPSGLKLPSKATRGREQVLDEKREPTLELNGAQTHCDMICNPRKMTGQWDDLTQLDEWSRKTGPPLFSRNHLILPLNDIWNHLIIRERRCFLFF